MGTLGGLGGLGGLQSVVSQYQIVEKGHTVIYGLLLVVLVVLTTIRMRDELLDVMI